MSGRSAPERLKIARQRIPTCPYVEFPHTVTTTRPRRPDVPRVHAPVRSLQAEFVLRSRTSAPPQGRRSNPASPPPLPRSGNHHSQVEHADILETINQNGIFGVALSVAYGRGTKPEYWESCRVLFQSKKRQIHDASSFRINQVIDEE